MERKTKVLSLNKGWIPIRLGSSYNAICKVYTDAAKAITFEGDTMLELSWDEWYDRSQKNAWPADQWFLNSTSGRVAVPRVIRLLNYGGIPRTSIKLNRENIYFRDAYKCYLCGNEFDKRDLSIDHIVPSSKGGKLEWTNVITCCKKCNYEKGDKLLSQMNVKPKFAAREPKTSNIMKLKQQVLEKHFEWEYFGV